MKQIHPERWRQQILHVLPRPHAVSVSRSHPRTRARGQAAQCLYLRQPHNHPRQPFQCIRLYSARAVERPEEPTDVEDAISADLTELPSPPPSAAFHSAKLSALHSRLALPHTVPLQTLAKCLVHATADPHPHFSNSSLALLGGDILGYFTAEHLLCNYPRLPMTVLFAAQNAYVGPAACASIVRGFGVEAVAEPGGEVDPGLLQFKRTLPGETRPKTHGIFQGDTMQIDKANTWRVKRVDKAGEILDVHTPRQPQAPADPIPSRTDLETASTSFLRALVGALTLHAGRSSVVSFHAQHILSRHLDIASLFHFRFPTRDLSRLCAREGFDPPVARLLSETGRKSIAPVFVVGVYSGLDKLGEGAGGSLDEARNRAAANALRGWYLYRPQEVVKPSEVEGEGQKRKWIPNFIDCGEIVT
ncbi:ribonuclease III [Rhizodiscina lignyota]|uniref:Large ribosomal subunit protein mL44 n=1 Tax=Rhizodiscina lignyota TaxID=1504668 RepID=A0A9P4I6H8_9PEZI|nr:ribonuclease III [Rhizodiscina lignyota]